MDDREVEATYDLIHQAALSGVDSVFKSEDWRNHPLFRTDLPKDVENDRYLGAFQHVTYDGETPDSIAANFKEIGNNCFRSGKQGWLTAANWWSRALEEKITDNKLKSVLFSNRATVSLGLGQFQRAALDANWAIENDKFNRKAYLRAAHAYQGISDWDKAISAAKAGLEIVDESDPMRKQLQEVVDNCEKQRGDISNHVAQFFTSITACDSFFKRENFAIGEFHHSWQGNWNLLLQFDEEKNETIWPIAISYEEVLQVDFCDAFHEKTPLIKLLEMIFPGVLPEAQYPNWDTEKRYRVPAIIPYVQTYAVQSRWGSKANEGDKKFVMLSPNATLHDLFTQKDYIIPGYPILMIAVKGSEFFEKLGIKEIILPGGARRKVLKDDIEPPPPLPNPLDVQREIMMKEHSGKSHYNDPENEEGEKGELPKEEPSQPYLPIEKPKA